jgi:hypothetical protein
MTEQQYFLVDIIKQEYKKISQKGPSGIVASFAIACAFFWYAPEFAKFGWPYVLNVYHKSGLPEWVFMMGVAIFWHLFWVIVSNLCMWVIYNLEHSFFERHRLNDNPWPWV